MPSQSQEPFSMLFKPWSLISVTFPNSEDGFSGVNDTDASKIMFEQSQGNMYITQLSTYACTLYNTDATSQCDIQLVSRVGDGVGS